MNESASKARSAIIDDDVNWYFNMNSYLLLENNVKHAEAMEKYLKCKSDWFVFASQRS